MASPLDNIQLPYPDDPNAPAAPVAASSAPASTVAAAPAAPMPTHPDVDKIKTPYPDDPNAPANGAPPAAPPDDAGMLTHLARWSVGQNPDGSYSPINLQPRSLSQVGTDALNYGRVAGNQAVVPGALDMGLAALHGDAVADENKKTTQAESDLGPEAAAIARFQGQRLSVNRILGEAGVPGVNSPLAQGVVTGGGGTLLHGGSLSDAAQQTAIDTGANMFGQSVGQMAAGAGKWLDKSASAVTDEAKQKGKAAAAATLSNLHELWDTGSGDVAQAASGYAASAKGAAQSAYQNIAEKASQATDLSSAQRLVTSSVGNYIPGIGPFMSAYIAEPTVKAYNTAAKGVDVRSAIDQAYQPVANVAKTAIDPEAWRSAFGTLALSSAPSVQATKDKLPTFSPSKFFGY